MPFVLNPNRSDFANAHGWLYYVKRDPTHRMFEKEAARLKAWFLERPQLLITLKDELAELNKLLEAKKDGKVVSLDETGEITNERALDASDR